ncbi:MAG: hypothetical protein KJP00_04800 [Bacteroidia bacterium]|nr:hypothetical protein [Bacteroidia bacterium]
MNSGPRIIFNVIFFGFLIGATFLTGCFEPSEGCLDSNATNFDVHADENCCCTFPSITVGVNQVVGDEDFSSDSIYVNDLGERFRILESSFYISGFKLEFENGSETSILDTLLIEIPEGSGAEIELEDNYNLVYGTSSAFAPGTIGLSGEVAFVSFVVGVDALANMAIPDQFQDTHPLGSNNSDLHFIEGEGYVFNRIDILPVDLPSGDTVSIVIYGDDHLQSVQMNADFSVIPGLNTILGIDVDYGKWVEGINFAAQNEVIQSRIEDNTASVFSLTQ